MLYRASVFAAILAAGARAGGGEAFMHDDTSCAEDTPAESCALQVKLERASYIVLNYGIARMPNHVLKMIFHQVCLCFNFQNKASCLCHIHIIL